MDNSYAGGSLSFNLSDMFDWSGFLGLMPCTARATQSSWTGASGWRQAVRLRFLSGDEDTVDLEPDEKTGYALRQKVLRLPKAMELLVLRAAADPAASPVIQLLVSDKVLGDNEAVGAEVTEVTVVTVARPQPLVIFRGDLVAEVHQAAVEEFQVENFDRTLADLRPGKLLVWKKVLPEESVTMDPGWYWAQAAEPRYRLYACPDAIDAWMGVEDEYIAELGVFSGVYAFLHRYSRKQIYLVGADSRYFMSASNAEHIRSAVTLSVLKNMVDPAKERRRVP